MHRLSLRHRGVEALAGCDYVGVAVQLIGGADEAAELDAKRAIEQGTRIAVEL